jgi:hypothetical protein
VGKSQHAAAVYDPTRRNAHPREAARMMGSPSPDSGRLPATPEVPSQKSGVALRESDHPSRGRTIASPRPRSRQVDRPRRRPPRVNRRRSAPRLRRLSSVPVPGCPEGARQKASDATLRRLRKSAKSADSPLQDGRRLELGFVTVSARIPPGMTISSLHTLVLGDR